MTTQQEDSKQNTPHKKRLLVGLVLAGILLSGLALRISYLREIVNNPDFSLPQLDACFHDYWARGLVAKDWTIPKNYNDPRISVSPYFRPPGYPFFLALIYYLSGCNYLAARIVQMGLGLVNCLLAYFLGRSIFGRATGLIFAAFMSVYWVFIYFEGELLAPVLLVTLALALMYILYLWCDRLTFWRALGGGIFLGLFALVRPNILLFGPVVLGWFWWVAHRRNIGSRIGTTVLGFLLGAVIAIAPATIRNYIVANDFVLITSNAGINLYIGNNENSNGFAPSIPPMKEVSGVDWASFDYPKIVRGIERFQGKKMKHSEVSSYFAKKAIDYIRKHPVRTLRLMAIKTALFWGPVEVPNNKEIHYEKQNSTTLRYIPGFPMVISLAIAGLMQLFLGLKKRPGGNQAEPLVTQRQFEVSILLLLFIITYFISFLPFFVAERFRVPIIPFLLLFGAYGLFRIGQKAASRNFYKVVCWGTFCIVLYLAESMLIVSYKPELSRWHYLRGDVYSCAEQFDLAIEQYRQAVKLRPDFIKARSNLAEVLAQEGKYTEAIEHYVEVLRLRPDLPDIYSNLGRVYAQQDKYELAIQNYNESLRLKPDYLPAINNLGTVLKKQGKVSEAIKEWKKALEIEPDYPHVHFNMGAVMAEQGKYDEAVSHYNEALRYNPYDYKTYCGLAAVLEKQGKTNEVIKHLYQAQRLAPENPQVHKDLGLALAQQGNLSEAITQLQKALELNPELAAAHYGLADIFLQQSRVDQALPHFKELLRLEPDKSQTYNKLGMLLAQQGKLGLDAAYFDLAIVYFNRALKLNPQMAQARYNLAEILLQQGKLDESINHAKEYLKLKPDNPKIHANLAEALTRKGKVEQAIPYWFEALRLDPNLPAVQNKLAEVLYQQGKLEEAIEHWKQALRLEPDWPRVLNNLAWIMATHENEEFRNPSKALQYAQKACELTRARYPDLLETLSAAYAAAGRFPEAVETAEKALNLALSANQQQLVDKIQNLLELYKRGQPYRDSVQPQEKQNP